MKKRVKALLFKTPAILLLVISFMASIYAAIRHISGISWAVPIILLIIVVLYFIGERVGKKDEWGFY
jgi:uncharacterized protein YacL